MTSAGNQEFYAHTIGTFLQRATRLRVLGSVVLQQDFNSCFVRTSVVPRIVDELRSINTGTNWGKATIRALINHPSRQHFLLVASLLTSSVISLGEKEQEGRVGNSEEKIG